MRTEAKNLNSGWLQGIINELQSLQVTYEAKYQANEELVSLPATASFYQKNNFNGAKAAVLIFTLLVDIPLIALLPVRMFGFWKVGHTNKARIQPIQVILEILKGIENKPNYSAADRAKYSEEKAKILKNPSKKNSPDYQHLMSVLEKLDTYFGLNAASKSVSRLSLMNTGFVEPLVDIVHKYQFETPQSNP